MEESFKIMLIAGMQQAPSMIQTVKAINDIKKESPINLKVHTDDKEVDNTLAKVKKVVKENFLWQINPNFHLDALGKTTEEVLGGFKPWETVMSRVSLAAHGVVKAITDIGTGAAKLALGFGKALLSAVGLEGVVKGILKVFSFIMESITFFGQRNEEIQNKVTEIQQKVDGLKYAIGSAFAPVLNWILDILNWILDRIVAIVSYVNIFVKALGFAGMNMSGFAKDMGSAAKGASKLKKQLAGFDDLNNLTTNQGGGSGGGGSIPNPFADFTPDEGIVKTLEWIAGFIKENLIPIVAGLTAGLIALKLFGLDPIVSMGIGLVVAGILASIQDVIEFLKDPSWEKLWSMLGDWVTDIGLIVAGIGLITGSPVLAIVGSLAVVIGEVIKHWDEFKQTAPGKWIDEHLVQPVKELIESVKKIWNSTDNVWKKVKKTLKEALKTIKKIFEPLVEWFDKNIGQPIAKVFEFLFGNDGKGSVGASARGGLSLIKNPFEAAGGIWTWFKDKVGGGVSSVFEKLFGSSDDGSIGKRAIEGVSNLKLPFSNNTVGEWFNKNVTKPIGSFFSKLFGTGEGSVGESASKGKTNTQSPFKTLGQWFGDNITGGAKGILSKFKTLFGDTGTEGSIAKWAKGGKERTQNQFTTLGEWFGQHITGGAKGILSKFKTLFGDTGTEGSIAKWGKGGKEKTQNALKDLPSWTSTNVVEKIRSAFKTLFGDSKTNGSVAKWAKSGTEKANKELDKLTKKVDLEFSATLNEVKHTTEYITQQYVSAVGTGSTGGGYNNGGGKENIWDDLGKGHADGVDYVPNDAIALIHQGEAIIPAKFNEEHYFTQDETNELLRTLIDTLERKDMSVSISENDIGRASVNYINRQSRIMGGSIV